MTYIQHMWIFVTCEKSTQKRGWTTFTCWKTARRFSFYQSESGNRYVPYLLEFSHAAALFGVYICVMESYRTSTLTAVYSFEPSSLVCISLEAGSFILRRFFAGTRGSCFCLEANAIRDLRSVTFVTPGDKCLILAVVATVCSLNVSFQLHDSIFSMIAAICNHGQNGNNQYVLICNRVSLLQFSSCSTHINCRW